ncbi:hypothetical protein YC2023_081804 [Brassica napus]
MDVARVLVEVNLMQPLPEKICFKDKNQDSITVEVKYPWLPPRCTLCNEWGHTMKDCAKPNSQIVLQRKQSSDKQHEVPAVGKGMGKEVVLKLLEDLERVDKENDMQRMVTAPVEYRPLSEPTNIQEELVEVWETNGKPISPRVGNNSHCNVIVESPNGFQVLSDIREEDEREEEKEEGEIEDEEHQEVRMDTMFGKFEMISAVGKSPESTATSTHTVNHKGRGKPGLGVLKSSSARDVLLVALLCVLNTLVNDVRISKPTETKSIRVQFNLKIPKATFDSRPSLILKKKTLDQLITRIYPLDPFKKNHK